MPQFSVIIPTYNRAHLVNESIQSVLDQTYSDVEIIVVDDGSTDNTKTVVETFADDRIKYIYQKNAERGAARNNGVLHSSGKYVFFLDSDDKLDPDHLDFANKNLQELGTPEFFHIRYREEYPDTIMQVEKLNKSSILQRTLEQNQFACQFFLREDIARKFPFINSKDLKIGEDWYVVLRIALRYPLYFSNEVKATIVHHGERSMEISSPDVILTSREELINALKKDKRITNEILNNVYVEHTTLAALAASIKGQKKVACRLLYKAFKKKKNVIVKRRTLAIIKKVIFGQNA